MKLTILITCFNEQATILTAINEARKLNLDKEIIVIDNNSTDSTREILSGLKNDRDLKIVFHSKNMGPGYSTREGIQLAQSDYFYAPCADLEYQMEDVYKMISKMEEEKLDAVLGSRLPVNTKVSAWQLFKERPYWLGTFIATFLINLLYRKNFTDILSIHLFRTDVLKGLDSKSNKQAFMFELISKICKNNRRIGEIPVSYKPRTHKEGKTTRAWDIIPIVWAIIKVRFS